MSQEQGSDSTQESGVKCAKISAWIAWTIFSGAFVTATVFLGNYGLRNPDPVQCWVVRGVETTALTKAEIIATADFLNIDVPDGYPIEMHEIFIAWLLWGFYSQVVVGTLVIFAALLYCCAEKAGMLTGAIICGLYTASAIVWVSAGAIWRFSKAGITAAGDSLEKPTGTDEQTWQASVNAAKINQGYQVETGRFMKIYLLVAGIFIAVVIIGTIWFATVMACCSPVKEYNSLEDKGVVEASDQSAADGRSDSGDDEEAADKEVADEGSDKGDEEE